MTRSILIAINKPKRMQRLYLACVKMRDTPLEIKEVGDSQSLERFFTIMTSFT